jgi:hypothetical protein
MKIRPVEAELFHADRQTDEQTYMKKLIVAFCKFAKAPENVIIYRMWQKVLKHFKLL